MTPHSFVFFSHSPPHPSSILILMCVCVCVCVCVCLRVRSFWLGSGLVVVLLVGVMLNYLAYIGSTGISAYDSMYCKPLVRRRVRYRIIYCLGGC